MDDSKAVLALSTSRSGRAQGIGDMMLRQAMLLQDTHVDEPF